MPVDEFDNSTRWVSEPVPPPPREAGKKGRAAVSRPFGFSQSGVGRRSTRWRSLAVIGRRPAIWGPGGMGGCRRLVDVPEIAIKGIGPFRKVLPF